jgi:excisionase family DNA binding protein
VVSSRGCTFATSSRGREEGTHSKANSVKAFKPMRKNAQSTVKAEDLLQSDLATSPDLTLADQIEGIGHALTADDLATILAASRITIFKHAKAGRIPSFRIGTRVRFDPRAVARWLRSQ